MHPHDLGLTHDLTLLRQRRALLRWVAGAALLPLAGCGAGLDLTGDGGTSEGDGTCAKIPEETAGPYPADGSNGPNALALSGIVRSDLRSSFAGYAGTAAGVPLTVELTLVDVNGSCGPLEGYAVYLWHCDREGKYSMYDLTNQNYLRGVQSSDASGKVSFVTVYPGCYSGRWPHIHFEIYPSAAVAASAGSKLQTSQLALPSDVSQLVYASSGYASSVRNLSQTSLATDMVFRDGSSQQLAAVTGSVAAGYLARLTVGVAG